MPFAFGKYHHLVPVRGLFHMVDGTDIHFFRNSQYHFQGIIPGNRVEAITGIHVLDDNKAPAFRMVHRKEFHVFKLQPMGHTTCQEGAK